MELVNRQEREFTPYQKHNFCSDSWLYGLLDMIKRRDLLMRYRDIKTLLRTNDRSCHPTVLNGIRDLNIKYFDIRDLEVPSSEEFNKEIIDRHPFNLPYWLVNSINRSVSYNIGDIIEDVRIGISDLALEFYSIIEEPLMSGFIADLRNTPEGAELAKLQNDFLRSLKAQGSAYENFNASLSGDWRERGYHSLSKSESAKRQLLFGVPFTYNLMMEGNFFSHPDLLQNDISQQDKKVLEEVFDCFKSVLVKRMSRENWNVETRLPVGTSQGILLKSKSDSLLFKNYMKYCLSLLASKCTSHKELLDSLEYIGSAFSDQGFDNPYNDCFLGLRRMHMSKKKSEPVFTDRGVLVDATNKCQGRIRAIFPFTESLKYWIKRYCDPIKKELFTSAGVFSVDPECIRQAHIETHKKISSSPELIKAVIENETCYTHYDAKAWDTTIGRYQGDLYNKLMKGVLSLVGNGNDLWGESHNNSGIIFLNAVNPKADPNLLMRELSKGRAIMSGQADVTLKNNIIHFCNVIASLIDLYGKPDNLETVINSALDSSRFKFGKKEVILHIHGDDIFLFHNQSSEMYIKYVESMKRKGINCGFESGPVFLKKVLNKNNQLEGICGSLFKNRLGEYHISYFVTGFLGLIDNLIMERSIYETVDLINVKQDRQNCELKLYRFFFDLWNEHLDYHLSKLQSSEERDNLDAFGLNVRAVSQKLNAINSKSSVKQLEEIQVLVSKILSKSLEIKTPASVNIRKALLAASYKSDTTNVAIKSIIESHYYNEPDSELISSSEEFTNIDEIREMFNTYSITDTRNLDISDDSILKWPVQLSREQLTEFLREIQIQIITNGGAEVVIPELIERFKRKNL